MDTGYWWVYDLMTVVVVIGCMVVSAKRGFLKTLIIIVGYLLACAGGFFVANKYADSIYDKYVSGHCEEYVEENITDFNVRNQIREVLAQENIPVTFTDQQIDEIVNKGGTVSDGVIDFLAENKIPVTDEMADKIREKLSSDSIVNNLDGKINKRAYNLLVEYNKISDNAIDDILESLVLSDKKSIAQKLSDVVIKPIILKILKVLIFILVFLVIIIIVKIVAGLMGFVNKVPIAGGINRMLGGVLGFLQGILMLYVVALLLKLIIAVTSNDLMVINDATINAGNIFKEIYNYNLFK